MQVVNMKFTRRFNLGNYEHEEFTFDVAPDEDQSAEDMLEIARKFAETKRPALNGAQIEAAAIAKPARRSAKSAPFDGGTDTIATIPIEKPKRTRKKKVEEPTETMADLLAVFEPVDLKDPDLDFNELAALCIDVAERFRAINSPDDASDEKRQVIAMLRDCRAAIDAS